MSSASSGSAVARPGELRGCMRKDGDQKPRQQSAEKRVRFDNSVRVAMLPQEQRIDARKARKGLWKPGPPHDELWDGDLLEFREVELTGEEFKQLMRKQGKRTSLPRTLQTVQRLFSVASEKLSLPVTPRFGGVDVVSARARLSEDFDEDDREESSAISTTPEKERETSSTNPVIRRSSNVRVSYVDFEGGTPPPSPTRQQSLLRTTRFEASPPSGPSPSEVTALRQAAVASFARSSTEEPDAVTVTNKDSTDVSAVAPRNPIELGSVPEVESTATFLPTEQAKKQAKEEALQPINSKPGAALSQSFVVPRFVRNAGIVLILALFTHVFLFRITLFRILMAGSLAAILFVGFVVVATNDNKAKKTSSSVEKAVHS